MKKVLLGVLILTFFIMSCTFAAAKFSDLQTSHWAYGPVSEMAARGILIGYPDGTFMPDKSITRAEYSKIMVMALDLEGKNKRAIESTNELIDELEKVEQKKNGKYSSFADVRDDHWAKQYINLFAEYLEPVYKNGKYYFSPDSEAIREDVAISLVKAAGLENLDYDLKTLNKFSDKDQISSNAKKYVAIAVENELLRGHDNGTFEPKGYLTRAQVCQIVINTEDVLAKIKAKEEAVFDGLSFDPKTLSVDLGSNWEKFYFTSIEKSDYSKALKEGTVYTPSQRKLYYNGTYLSNGIRNSFDFNNGDAKTTFIAVLKDDLTKYKKIEFDTPFTILANGARPGPIKAKEITVKGSACNGIKSMNGSWSNNTGTYMSSRSEMFIVVPFEGNADLTIDVVDNEGNKYQVKYTVYTDPNAVLPSPTPNGSVVPTQTPSPTGENTPVPTNGSTNAPAPTPTNTEVPTPTPTNTEVPTPTAGPNPTQGPNGSMDFSDVYFDDVMLELELGSNWQNYAYTSVDGLKTVLRPTQKRLVYVSSKSQNNGEWDSFNLFNGNQEQITIRVMNKDNYLQYKDITIKNPFYIEIFSPAQNSGLNYTMLCRVKKAYNTMFKAEYCIDNGNWIQSYDMTQDSTYYMIYADVDNYKDGKLHTLDVKFTDAYGHSGTGSKEFSVQLQNDFNIEIFNPTKNYDYGTGLSILVRMRKSNIDVVRADYNIDNGSWKSVTSGLDQNYYWLFYVGVDNLKDGKKHTLNVKFIDAQGGEGTGSLEFKIDKDNGGSGSDSESSSGGSSSTGSVKTITLNVKADKGEAKGTGQSLDFSSASTTESSYIEANWSLMLTALGDGSASKIQSIYFDFTTARSGYTFKNKYTQSGNIIKTAMVPNSYYDKASTIKIIVTATDGSTLERTITVKKMLIDPEDTQAEDRDGTQGSASSSGNIKITIDGGASTTLTRKPGDKLLITATGDNSISYIKYDWDGGSEERKYLPSFTVPVPDGSANTSKKLNITAVDTKSNNKSITVTVKISATTTSTSSSASTSTGNIKIKVDGSEVTSVTKKIGETISIVASSDNSISSIKYQWVTISSTQQTKTGSSVTVSVPNFSDSQAVLQIIATDSKNNTKTVNLTVNKDTSSSTSTNSSAKFRIEKDGKYYTSELVTYEANESIMIDQYEGTPSNNNKWEFKSLDGKTTYYSTDGGIGISGYLLKLRLKDTGGLDKEIKLIVYPSDKPSEVSTFRIKIKS